MVLRVRLRSKELTQVFARGHGGGGGFWKLYKKTTSVVWNNRLAHQLATPPSVSRAHDRRPGVLPLAVVPVMVGQNVPQEVVPDVPGALAAGRVVAAPQRCLLYTSPSPRDS